MVVALALLACNTEPTAEPAIEPEMGAVDLLIRASLDLRGVRPGVADLEAVEADPEALDALIDDYLYDEGFGQRVRDLYAEVYLTRTESFSVAPESFGYDDADYPTFEHALGNETLHILSEVAEQDLPWSTIVTADWTMADEMLESIFPVERDEGDGWQRATYTDGRPAAGVLHTNSMWWRYTTTTSNANRARANAMSRILLCDDYLTRPIEFDRNVNLLDEEAVLEAIENDPACVSCHVSLDPLASYLFGFFWFDPSNALEVTTYKPEREKLYNEYTGKEPAFYGEPGYSLSDLGHQIAGDDRFVECAVEQVYEGLLRRDATLADADALTRHREAFLDGGLTLRSLIRSVLDDPRYRAGNTDTVGYVPRKMVSPDLLAMQVEGLTGYAWTYADYDMMRTDRYGYRTLAGGADGYNVTRVADRPNTTLLLVQERLAQAAARYAVDMHDAGEGNGLFAEVDFSETPETERDPMVAQVQLLHWKIFGERVDADGEEVEANLALWEDLYALDGDPEAAWAGVLSVLLRDPDFLFY